MMQYPLRTESRYNGSNFTGTGFIFLRYYETLDDRYPFEVGLHQHEWHEFVWNHSPAVGDLHVCTMDGVGHPYGDRTLLYAPPFHAHKFLVSRPLGFWIIGVDQTQTCKMFAHSPLSKPLEELFASWRNLPVVMDAAAGEVTGGGAAGDVGSALVAGGLVGGVAGGPAAALDALCASKPPTGSLESLEAIHFLVSLDRILAPWKQPAAGVPEDEVKKSAGSERVVRAAMEFLERNFARPVGVEECAAHIGVARSTLSHNFRSFTGQSIPQWLSEIRLRHARALLMDTNLDIIEVAMECGFNDPAWFSRQFRASVGMPPSEWRVRSKAVLNSSGSMHDFQGQESSGGV